MKLSIDATANTVLKLSLDSVSKTISYDSPREQDTLAAIHAFLTEQDVVVKDLSSINVNPGPGNFTSIRTSIATAQALSLALNIPINELSPGSSIEAIYGQEPSITLRK